MRIGIYSPYLPTLSGGEKYILTLATCLAESDTVEIFWDESERESLAKPAKEKLGIDLRKIAFVKNIFSSQVSFLERLIVSRKYDRIIYLSDGSIPLLACPLIIHFQTPVEWVRVSLKTKMKMFRVKKIICNSQFTKTFIDKKFGVRSQIIYPPVALGDKDLYKKEKYILNVGRFGINQAGSSYKKQDALIAAFKKMVDNGLKGWELILVVSVMDQDKEQLNELQKSIGSYPITCIMNPSNKILWEWYDKAKIYWHASGFGEDVVAHPDRAEHFGIATVEAMSTGCVPVVIGLGGQVEIVVDGENGYLWGTLDELIEKTTQIIQDAVLWKKLSHGAVVRSEHFGLEQFCQEVAELIA